MIRYECDRCRVKLGANDPQRYILRMEVYAAAGHMGDDPIAEAAAAGPDELHQVLEELAAADPDEVEDQTYRALRFDLCDACRREVIRKPLG